MVSRCFYCDWGMTLDDSEAMAETEAQHLGECLGPIILFNKETGGVFVTLLGQGFERPLMGW